MKEFKNIHLLLFLVLLFFSINPSTAQNKDDKKGNNNLRRYSLNPPVYVDSLRDVVSPPMYVYDRFGDSVLFDDIKIPQHTVPAGIFMLHFIDEETNTNAINSFDDPSAPVSCGTCADIGQERRNVITQVFTDISFLLSTGGGLAGLPNPYPGITKQRVDIQIRSGSAAGVDPGAIAFASQYYQDFGTGITYGNVWEAITTGFNPNDNLGNTPFAPSPIADNARFYCGFVQVDFGFPYYTNLNNPTGIGATQFDLYSVVLHEVFHMLGIASAIDQNGTSLLRPDRYTIYDTYLRLANNTQVINNQDNCYNTTFNVNTNDIVSGCGSPVRFNGINTTQNFTIVQPVYSPAVYDPGSSLSHFNCAAGGLCPAIYSTNGYVTNFCSNLAWVQRTPHEAEVRALCDLGYSITGTYGSGATSRTYTNVCGVAGSNLVVAGINDFRPYSANNTGADFTVVAGQSINLGFNDILRNDINTTALSCPEIVFGGGSITGITGYWLYL